jgi:hypothetical protein
MMTDSVEYELICLDNTIDSQEDLDWLPLHGVKEEQLIWAHRVANLVLTHTPSCDALQTYTNRTGNAIRLPQTTADNVFATLKFKRIDPKSVAAIAEVATILRCKLVPGDDGPEVAPDAEALMQDLTRRALQGLRPQGKSLFEQAGGAARAVRITAEPDRW